MMRPRPSKPSASQPGWAERARATISLTWSPERSGTDAMTWPVAGFSTGISSRVAWPLVLTTGVSVLAMDFSPLLRAAPQANDFLRNHLELPAHPRMDPAEVGVAPDREALRRRGHRVGRAPVDRVVAEGAGVPDAVGPRVVGDVGAVARQVARGHRVPDVG